MDLNKAMIIGRLTQDPEVKTTPNGQNVASFSVATNYVWTDQSGQKQEKVEYHNIVVWRKLADICGQYLRKGSKVYMEGRIQTRSWEGQDGQKKYRTEIIADNMIMLDSRGGGQSGPQTSAPAPAPSSGPVVGPDEPPVIQVEAPTPNPTNADGSDKDKVSIEDIPF